MKTEVKRSGKEMQNFLFLHFLTSGMSWEEKAHRLLRLRLGGKPFAASEAARVLSKERKLSIGTTYRLLHDLVRTGRLEKLGRGLYHFPSKPKAILGEIAGRPASSGTSLPEADETVRRVLEDRGIRFMITGPSLLYPFIHHFPRRMIHLVYVMEGGGESAREALREVGLRALLRPSREEIRLALEEFPEDDLFVLREISDFRGESNGVADLERALVDTYFETTRKRIPFPPEELGRIASRAISTGRVNVSHLLMLAGRRGVKGELRTVLERSMHGLRVPGAHVSNRKVESVLAGIAAEER